MKKIFTALLVTGVLALTGCATPKFALEYRTETTLELDGRIFVGGFGYSHSHVNPNQIPNTALGGGIILTEPVAEFFANAIKREFREAGLSIKQGGCQLTGHVKKVLIDDLGFSVDLDMTVKYLFRDRNGAVLLYKSYTTALEKLTKFTVIEVILSNINRMFANNIKQLMEDPLFNRSLEESCEA